MSLQKLETPPKRVLDLGCGRGTWIIAAAQAWPVRPYRSFARSLTIVLTIFLRRKNALTGNVLRRVRRARLSGKSLSITA